MTPPLAPARLERAAEIPSGVWFWFGGRPLRIERVVGPVVVAEELTAVGDGLPGQYALWGADAVAAALAGGRP